MVELNLTSKCQEKLRKEYGSTRYPEFSLKILPGFLVLLCFFVGCAERATRVEPRVAFEDPLHFVDAPADDLYRKAYADYLKGNLQKARNNFQKKIEKSSDHYPSYLGIAYTYLAERDWNQAQAYIRKTLELKPDYPQAHFAMAYTLDQLQDYDAALAELNEASRLAPEYPGVQDAISVMKLKATEAHLNQAEQLEQTEPEEALRHLKTAQELAPEMSDIPVRIARILVNQDRCDEAISYLQIAIQQAPQNPESKRQLADCFKRLKRYAEALPLYETLAGGDPQNEELRSTIEDLKKRMYVENLPQEYQQIPQASQITRAQMAALLAVNLEFLQKYSSPTSHILVDTIGHWAKNFILKAVNLAIMDAYPNRTFQPDQPLTRLELAKAASRILEILQSNEGKTIDNGKSVTISDIPGDNVYFPMIAKAVTAGVISLDGDGGFHPNRPVSGSEAISLVNRLQQIAE